MRKAQLISKIDEILERHQFCKSGLLWSRVYASYIDVIDLQISKSKDMFTINAGVADKYVMRACWGLDGSDMVEEPSCTTRARLGQLLHGRDVWWSVANDDEVEEVLSGIENAAIPFLQLNHSIDHMIESLENNPTSKRYPPGIIYLALLYHRKGDRDRCREMFNSTKLTGAWNEKAFLILRALN